MENIRVLMVDDNINLVEMIKEYFSSHQFIVSIFVLMMA